MSQGPAVNVSSLWVESSGATSAGRGAKTGAQIAFANLPLTFEANQGQTDSDVKFLARGGGYTLFLTQDEAALELQSSAARQLSAKHSASSGSASVLRMKLVGADSRAKIGGTDLLSSRSNYLIGNDPGKWRRNVPEYGRVRYQQIYPGVDLVYYGNQGRLEYDFEVAPQTDPEEIELRIDGAKTLRVTAKGDLLAQTAAGDVELHAPEVYQTVNARKRNIAGRFVLTTGNRVNFAVGEYDRNLPLVIDPQLSYSTYFGGSGNEGCNAVLGSPVPGCPAIAVDGAFNRYVAGSTTSTDFPTSTTAFQKSLNGTAADAFVTKFNAAGSIIFSTYLGGNGTDTTVGVGFDPTTNSPNVYVAGNTTSTDFPELNEFQPPPPSGNSHVFVSVLKSDGSGLVYSTYLYGSNTDIATGLANDDRGNAFVTGITRSTNFPTTQGAFQFADPGAAFSQFFMSKIATGSSGTASLAYSTYFGASNAPSSGAVLQGGGIAVDSGGFVYITGGTNFLHTGSAGDFPILNAYQACLDDPAAVSSCPTTVSNTDAFVAKLNPAVNAAGQLQYSTYLGGSGVDTPYGIAVDTSGNAYVTGGTNSSDFKIPSGIKPFQLCLNSPATTVAPCPPPGTTSDAFVAKIGAGGNTLAYFSYLGGSGADTAYAIAVDSNLGIHITGSTSSTDFPQVPAGVSSFGGAPDDAFVALMQTSIGTGQTGGDSRYLGGNAADDGTGIAVDTNATTYVAGETTSTNFPVTNATTLNGGANTTNSDAFITALSDPAALTINTPTVSPNPVGIGNQVTFAYSFTNNTNNVANNIFFVDNLSTGANFVSATSTPGSCAGVVNASVTCSIGALAPSATATVRISLTPTIAGSLGNGGNLLANGAPGGSVSANAAVIDFSVGVSPSTNVVVAGNSATYQAQVGVPTGQTNFFPNSVSLSCSAGVPSGATCAFSTSPVTMTNTSAVTSTLTITTTARPVPTTAERRSSRYWYAAMLPIPGLMFLGLGMGAGRRRMWVIAVFCLLAFALAGFQLACSSGSGTTTPPTGTPAGTYAITLTGTSGSASHATRLTLVVQ